MAQREALASTSKAATAADPTKPGLDVEQHLEENIRYQLTSSGERDRIKAVLKRKLKECGWHDEVKQLCQDHVASHGQANVTVEDMVKAVRPAGRSAVPDSVKAELLAQIKTFISSIKG